VYEIDFSDSGFIESNVTYLIENEYVVATESDANFITESVKMFLDID
jgi:hypothetical protein